MQQLYEVRVFILESSGPQKCYKVMLEHPNGDREISHQTYSTRDEVEAAVRKYAEDTNGTIQRAN